MTTPCIVVGRLGAGLFLVELLDGRRVEALSAVDVPLGVPALARPEGTRWRLCGR